MSLRVEWNNEQDQIALPQAFLGKLDELLQIAGRQEGITAGEVALTFVTDEEIHELNRTYRGIDRATDVLSFAMQEESDEELDIVYEVETEEEELPFDDVLGDIIISVPRALEQSEAYGHSLERELAFLFVHGFLHLIGYDHQDAHSEQVMTGKQEAVLAEAGFTRE